jgi:trigger factor
MSTVQLNNVTVERSEDGLVTLQIEVAPEEVRAARERAIKEYSRRLRIPGFRPGHIPANIVRRNVGDESIAQRVSDQLVSVAYQQALEQTELQPLERAEVDQLTFDAFEGDKPLQFTARVVVRPPVELGETRGLTVTRPTVEVTEEDIDKAIEELRTEHATLRNVEDRGAQEGDILVAELQVFIDDKPRSEEPTRLRPFVLGESSFVPRIDEHLLGAHLDEERRFNVTYPSDFQDTELAGQVAEFVVKVTALKERVPAELNDEFANRIGVEDISGVRERLRQLITENREREARDAVRAQLSQAATDAAQLEVPSRLVDIRLERRIKNLEYDLGQREATLEQYLQDTGQTREDFEAELRREVEADLRRELVLDEIARRENLSVSDEEIETHYRALAALFEQPLEKVIEQFDVHSVRASILRRKAVDWLMENAHIEGSEPVATDEGPKLWLPGQP